VNIRAAKFVQSLRGLNPTEKCLLQNMAIHADVHKCEATMSMTTLAAESGLAKRETASRNVTTMEEVYGVIRTVGLKSAGGKTSTYTFTFQVNRDCGVTVEDGNCDRSVTVDRDSGDVSSKPTVILESATVTPQSDTVTPASQEGFKGLKEVQRKKGKDARSLASDARQNLGQDEVTTLTDYVLETAFSASDGKLTVNGPQRAAIAKAVARYRPTRDEIKAVVDKFVDGIPDTAKDFSFACPKFAQAVASGLSAQITKEIADAKLADSVAKSIEIGMAARRSESDARAEKIREEHELAEALGDSPF
jgi:hypothetical protein